MNRVFNGKEIELIAPAGNFDILKGILNTSCDAVYCGGDDLNMRLIRKGYNLSREELRESAALAREWGKKLYITVNSLLDPGELEKAEDFLLFLEQIEPDGIIIQDTAVLEIINTHNLSIPVHASVMMNIHNLEMIRFFEERGISRVVVSREMSLDQIRAISQKSEIEIEYFTHGDMCVTHGSQCYYSSYLFGMSSNRGRCLKPCRWPYTLKDEQGKVLESPTFPLAVKDINLYKHLPEMLESGITSFKIEGRMREKEFITELVDQYGKRLDEVLSGEPANPADDTPLLKFRKRDYSTGYAFGNPGLSNINSRGEGTGKFYSTGKMFSEPTEEAEIVVTQSQNKIDSEFHAKPVLSVRVHDIEAAFHMVKADVDRIYLSGEPFEEDPIADLSYLRLLHLVCDAMQIELYLSLPRMTTDRQLAEVQEWLETPDFPVDGVLVTNAGYFKMLQDLPEEKKKPAAGDYTLNIYNAQAACFYSRYGMEEWAPSIELPYEALLKLPLLSESDHSASAPELILHGLPTVMLSDHDISGEKRKHVVLETPVSRLTVRKDAWGRYHMLPDKELSLLPRLPQLLEAGYRRFRLELQGYEQEEAVKVVRAAKAALLDPERSSEILQALAPIRGGFTYGSHG